MIILKSKLLLDKTISLQKSFLFDAVTFPARKPLLAIKKCFGNIEITKYRKLIRMNIDLDVVVNLECSYTLEPFDHELNIHEEVVIGDTFDPNSEAIIVEGDAIDLERILYAIISSSLPLKPVKPGAKLPKGGEGYRVLNDEQLAKDRSISGDSRFAKLDDFNLEDDD